MKRLIMALLVLAGCNGGQETTPEPTEPGVAARAIEELREQYDELARDGLDDPVKWAAEDIENIGDWDYRIVELEVSTAAELEAELNALGDDRWEVFWIESGATGYRVMLKKPSLSYLSKVPLSQLGRLIIPAPGEG